MEFLNLKIQNFMSLGEADLDLAGKGLVLIEGVNSDDSSTKSNGAGKSSISDALSWCLYGETARGESGDAIVNRTAGKGTRVRLVVSNGSDVFSICRHRKHKSGKNRLTLHKWPSYQEALEEDLGKANDLTCGTDKLTQELVEKIVGCSIGVFNAAVYCAQDRMPNLPGMTDKQLKELVEEAAGVTQLQAAYAETRTLVTAQERLYDELDAKLAAQEAILTSLATTLNDAETRLADWHTTQLIKITHQIDRVKEVQQEHEAAFIKRPTLEADLVETKLRIDEVKTRLAGLAGEQAELRRHDAAIALEDRQLAAAQSSLKSLANQIKRLKESYEHASGRIGTPCGECGKVIEANDLQSVVDAARRSLKDAVEQYKTQKEGTEQRALKVQQMRREREAFAVTLTDSRELAATLDKQTTRRTTLQSELSALAGWKDKLDAAQRDLDNVRAEKNPHEGAVEKIRQQIRQTDDQRLELLAKRVEAGEQLTLLKAAAEVFGPAGVRAHILDQVTPYLNARTSHYLNTLADENLKAFWSTVELNGKGEVKEKFNIDVQSLTAGTSFGLLSGGEKRKVRLACALALQDLIATRATQPISLFIADEIDDALDDAGLERLMMILEEKARERGTVLVISHADLNDWIREVTTVTKAGGISTVTGALIREY